jgi:hypothetical protein
MKRNLFVVLLLALLVVGTIGCTPGRNEQQLANIEAQLQTFTAALTSTQQELASAKQALSEEQDKTSLLQQHLQESQQVTQTTASSSYQEPAVPAVDVTTQSYTPYYNPPPYVPSPPTPPVPPYQTPSNSIQPQYYQGSLIWPDGRVTVYTPPPPGYIWDNGVLVPDGINNQIPNSSPVIQQTPRHNPITGTRYHWGD